MQDHVLWFDQPAGGDWNFALPLGNGRLGAMFFGDPHGEKLSLNEDSVWARADVDRNNAEALKSLPRVREMLLAGRPDEALFLANATMMGVPKRIQPYQTLGDLIVELVAVPDRSIKSYRRELDMDSGVARVAFERGGVMHRREAFVSAVDHCIVLRMSTDTPQGLSGLVELHRAIDAVNELGGDGSVRLHGSAGTHGTAFHAVAQVRVDGGSTGEHGDRVSFAHADAVTITISVGTDYRGDDPRGSAERDAAAAGAKPYEQLRSEHVADHQRWFRRAWLQLGAGDRDAAALPVNDRLKQIAGGSPDPALEAQYFDFGRYLLIGSSRHAPEHPALPANLQGVWCRDVTPPWSSDFHLNINLQMNDWPSGPTNLAACQWPLFDWMQRLVEQGRRTAKVHYGCRGWVAHHVSDAWGTSTPHDGATCGLWPTGGAWIATHLWEHYRFTGDDQFLRDTAYPILREACEFFLDFLVDVDGVLMCGPSSSPENSYRLPSGVIGHLCMGATMDNQILRELFSAAAAAARQLGLDEPFAESLDLAAAKLPPNQIGKHGQLMEWREDFDEPEPGHRHISQLFGLHPGTQLSPLRTPVLAAAARVTLERRLSHGGGHTGWSCAWLINHYARLHDGEGAYAMLQKLLGQSTLPNLLDTHPPFQIDGNFGGCAAIAEMLLQSHDWHDGLPLIHLLPALPQAWSEGAFRGLRARGAVGQGGITVNASWQAGTIQAGTLTADRSMTVALKFGGTESRRIELPAGEAVNITD